MLVIGGGPPVREIHRRGIELAGGGLSNVVIIPHASRDPRAGEKSAELWQSAGAGRVEVLTDLGANQTRASLRAATLIWFCGGSQVRLMRTLTEAGLLGEFHDLHERGTVIGGTSAGAAVLSQQMIAGPAGPRGTPAARVACLEIRLGLWPDVIVDQHFAQRRRGDRLRRLVLENPEFVGIGVDESTAVIVRDRMLEVVGKGQVHVFDARQTAANRPRPPARPPGVPAVGQRQPWSMLDAPAPPSLRCVTLSHGARYHLDQGLIDADHGVIVKAAE